MTSHLGSLERHGLPSRIVLEELLARTARAALEVVAEELKLAALGDKEREAALSALVLARSVAVLLLRLLLLRLLSVRLDLA